MGWGAEAICGRPCNCRFCTCTSVACRAPCGGGGSDEWFALCREGHAKSGARPLARARCGGKAGPLPWRVFFVFVPMAEKIPPTAVSAVRSETADAMRQSTQAVGELMAQAKANEDLVGGCCPKTGTRTRGTVVWGMGR